MREIIERLFKRKTKNTNKYANKPEGFYIDLYCIKNGKKYSHKKLSTIRISEESINWFIRNIKNKESWKEDDSEV